MNEHPQKLVQHSSEPPESLGNQFVLLELGDEWSSACSISESKFESIKTRYRRSLERVESSTELLSGSFELMVARDLRKLFSNSAAKGSAPELHRAYIELEHKYEDSLAQALELGFGHKIIMGKLSVVCRLIGKTAESCQLKEMSRHKRAQAGSDGFWSMMGY